MSNGMNHVILMGNLGSDPEFRTYPSGTAMLRFRLATNESYLDRNRIRQVRTDWHDVVLWGERAELVSHMLSKGSWVVVEGSLRTSSYEKDGTRRYRTEVVAYDLHFTPARATG
jgi:single-strand DNA-binding protein